MKMLSLALRCMVSDGRGRPEGSQQTCENRPARGYGSGVRGYLNAQGALVVLEEDREASPREGEGEGEERQEDFTQQEPSAGCGGLGCVSMIVTVSDQ